MSQHSDEMRFRDMLDHAREALLTQILKIGYTVKEKQKAYGKKRKRTVKKS